MQCKDRQLEKDRLANLMAFGEDLKNQKPAIIKSFEEDKNDKPKKKIDRFDECGLCKFQMETY